MCAEMLYEETNMFLEYLRVYLCNSSVSLRCDSRVVQLSAKATSFQYFIV